MKDISATAHKVLTSPKRVGKAVAMALAKLRGNGHSKGMSSSGRPLSRM